MPRRLPDTPSCQFSILIESDEYGLMRRRREMKEEAGNGRAPLAPSPQRTWFKLDNAAKIYPATYSRTQNHQYRWTATLSENVDSDILRSALAITMPRFPSIAVTLHRGLFWYYFEPTVAVPPIEAEKAYPLTHRSFREIRRCGFRVLVDGPSLSLEFFSRRVGRKRFSHLL